jgi:hypothetical protein
MHKKVIQISLAIVVIFFLAVLADLVPFWMPMMGEMIVLLLVTVCLLVWVAFILAEQAVDEREVVLAMKSGRIAYVAGLLFLLLALIVQVFAHAVDPFIPVALAVMVGSKVLSRLYLE